MNKTMKFGLLTTALAALSAPALAQDMDNNMSLRAGAFFATGVAKAAEGQNWFTIGIDYKLGDIDFTTVDYDGQYSVSLDYYGKGGFSNMPLLFNYTGKTKGFYWSGGVGLSFAHLPSNTDLEFGYQVSIGKDLNLGAQPFFVEIRFFGSSQDELNGFTLVGGIRF